MLSKQGTVVADYGTTAKDYSSDILSLTQKNKTLGTRFVGKNSLWCGILNKMIDKEMYCIGVATDQSDNRDSVFNCIDRISDPFEKDRKEKGMPEAVKRISKHMRAAMVGYVYSRRA